MHTIGRAGPEVDHPHAARPFAYLVTAVLLLSTVTPAIKYVFVHWSVEPLMLAFFLVTLAFLFLLAMTAVWDLRAIAGLAAADVIKLALLGILGVASYSLAAWGLMKTSVTHYTLIYSLIPALTTLFAFMMKREHVSSGKAIGVGVSVVGCIIAISQSLSSGQPDLGLGDGLVFLFTLMMAGHLALSTHIVKRYGAMAANTIMFGTSALLLFSMTLSPMIQMPAPECPMPIFLAVLYIGLATAAVFLLRYVSLQSLTPATVAGYHNLVPVCTIIVAHVCLEEPILVTHVIGGTTILIGLELVRRAKSPLPTPHAPYASVMSVRRSSGT